MDVLFDRQPPTAWERFQESPLLFVAQIFYKPSEPQGERSDNVRVVCISDTHNTQNEQPPLPDGDILIHAGDLTVSGTRKELDSVLSWLSSQPHPHKYFIAGNHDTCLADPATHQHVSSTYSSLTYLQDSSAHVTIRGRKLHVYGSPYTPKHGSWVFQYLRVHAPWYSATAAPTSEYESTKIWSRIPPLTDVLITHGPCFTHLDLNTNGCYALLTTLWHIRPRLHVFGHIHAARGVEFVKWDNAQKAYEDVCAQRASWGGLLRLAWWKLVGLLWREGDDAGTIMVNAASVGGFKDDQMKGAIVVQI